MISKEELKQMYYYVGIVFYEHKLVRVFRTKTNYDYVFYYDNNGKYSLLDPIDANILAEQLTPNLDVMRNESVANGEIKDINFDADLDVSFSQIYAESKTTFALKENSFEAELISDKDGKTEFKIYDKSQNESFVTKVSLINEANDQERGKMSKEDIHLFLSNLEQYKEMFPDENVDKILKRLDGYEAYLQDKNDFMDQHNVSDSVTGLHCRSAHKIYINQDKPQGENYEEVIKNDDSMFKVTGKHEVFHAMSSSYNQYEKGENGTIGLVDKYGNGVVFNEMFTTALAGKVDGKYGGYQDYMNYYDCLFDDKQPPTEMFRSYFDADLKSFTKKIEEEFNVSQDTALNIVFAYDHIHNVSEAQFFGNTDAYEKAVLSAYDRANLLTAMAKISQMTKGGQKIDEGKVDEITERLLMRSKDVDIIKNFIINPESVNTDEDIKTKIDLVLGYANENIISNYAFNNQCLNDDLAVDVKSVVSEKLNTLFEGDNAKNNVDYAHYYALTTKPEELINNLDLITEKFDKKSLITVQKSLLNLDTETDWLDVDEHKNKLMELYDSHNDFYKGLIKTTLRSGSSRYINKDLDLTLYDLYGKLTNDEKYDILSDLCKEKDSKKLNMKEFSVFAYAGEAMYENPQKGREVFKELAHKMNSENFKENMGILNAVICGNDNEHMNRAIIDHYLGAGKYDELAQKSNTLGYGEMYEECVALLKEKEQEQEQQKNEEKQNQQSDERVLTKKNNEEV